MDSSAKGCIESARHQSPAGQCRGDIAISVLVPIYNVEQYLDKCLSSLHGQTFPSFEAICINDGSTDGSRSILQRYLDIDERFRVIDKPNSGYGASLNAGLRVARGEYIGFLESDDFFEPDALERLYRAASDSPDVVKANFWLYWSSPEERFEPFCVVDDTQAGRIMAPLDDIAIFFRKPSIWSALYRRKFLKENGIDFLETPGASYQDAGFNFKVWATAKKVAYLEDRVLFYRQDNEKSSVKSPSKVFCVCDEYDSMESFVRERGESSSSALLPILERMKFDSYLWNYDRLDDELRLEFVSRVSAELADDLSQGWVDLSLFEPGAEAGFLALSSNPDRFVKARSFLSDSRGLSSVRYYLALGGVSLVAKVILFKLF
ncbi:MAG: glycosyltransferase family 2 protein, partial [Olsenella sp.]